ncbi:MAG: HU family DNA-binding protein [Paludibacter sp.]|nr:HU family DNA-binding protein [Paludibacter sp.]
MSKDKLHTADIAEKLAVGLSLNKRVAEDFMKALVAVIEESLLTNDTVKIKGLGTFKLQWNDPRKSVDVNTGDEIIIEGYYKVAFTPEEEVKALVNEPYAHLEPILLNDDVEESDGKSVGEQSEETVVPLKLFNEQATEIKDILSEINALNSKPDEVKKAGDKEDASVQLEEVEELIVKEEVVEPIVEQKENIAEEIKQPEIHRDKLSMQDEAAKGKKDKKNRKKGSNVLMMFIVGMIIGGALIYMLSYYDLLPDFSVKLNIDLSDESAVADNKGVVVPVVDTVKVDTVSVVDATPVDSLQLLFDEKRVYTEFIASEQVVAGSRLTRIALRHYGVKEFWVYIYEANKDKFTSPDQITPGIVLKIPKLNPVLADKNNPRCMEYALKLHDLYVGK